MIFHLKLGNIKSDVYDYVNKVKKERKNHTTRKITQMNPLRLLI